MVGTLTRPLGALGTLVFVLTTAFYGTVDAQPPANTVSTQRAAGVMRQPVYRLLRSARDCARDNDLACADANTDQVFALADLNSYERAQVWNVQALIEFTRGDLPAAIAAYDNMLVEPDAPTGLIRSAHYSLAQLYLREDRADDALAALDRWWAMANPSAPEPFVLRAQIENRRGRHETSAEAIEQALAMAESLGRAAEESWYRLRLAARIGLGQLAPAVETLETLLRLWPSRSYYLELGELYAQLGHDSQRRALFESAYAAGWLNHGDDLILLTGIRLGAGRIEDALNVLEQNRARGLLADGDALRHLISRLRDWAAGEPVEAEERETLIRNARREQQLAEKPRNLRL